MSKINFLKIVFIAYILAIAENAFSRLVHAQGLPVQFVVVFFVYLGMRLAARDMMILSLVFFVLKDALTIGPFGISLFSFLACIPLVRFLRARVNYESPFAVGTIAFFVLAVFHGVYILTLMLFFQREHAGYSLAQAVLFSPLINAFVAPLLFSVYKKIIVVE